MHLLRTPFQRWPLRYHILTASMVVAALALGGYGLVHTAASTSNARGAQLQSLQTQLAVIRGKGTGPLAGDFTHSLPLFSRSNDVVHELSRQAQVLGVQIASLSIAVTEPTNSDIRKVQLNLTASAEYRVIKAWLAEMLGRYPSLAIQSLSLRAMPNDAQRQEAQLGLVLFVKD